MSVHGFIINIDKINGINMMTVLFPFKQQDKWEYQKQMAPEESVVKALNEGKVTLDNGIVENGKIKGTTGDLKRFNEINKPAVVLAEIRHEKQGTLGYKLASSDGVVKNFRLKEVLAYAESKTNRGMVPFQNAIYIPKTDDKRDFIKSYTSQGFSVDLIKDRGNKYSKPAEKTKNTDAIDAMFTKEQQEELLKGKKAGVNIRIYANNKMTPGQMRIIRKGLEERLPMQLIASPDFSEGLMEIYRADLKYGYDIKPYLNPEYTPEQILEISTGYVDGVDVGIYADPKNTVETMAEIRMRLTHGIWKEEHALPSGKWI